MTFRRNLLVAMVLLASAATASAFQDEELGIRVTASVTSTSPGDRFEVIVERTWSPEITVEDFDVRALDPLTVELSERTAKENGDRLRFVAFAFVRTSFSIKAPVIRGRTKSGEPRIALGEAVPIEVTPRVDAKNPGAIEAPGDIEAQPRDLRRIAFAAFVAAALAASAVRALSARFRRRPGRRTLSKIVLDLGHLAGPGGERSTAGEHYAAVSELVREAIDLSYGIRAPWMTTIEFLRAAERDERIRPAERLGLVAFLGEADAVKFGRDEPPAAARMKAVELATSFVLMMKNSGGER